MKRTALQLAPLLNHEILRVVKAEQISTEDFVKELADLCGVSVRMIQHYRSGFYKLPADHIPVLCKRFGSKALADEVNRLLTETGIDVPDEYDLARLAARSVREDMIFVEAILNDFEDGIQPGERDRLRDLAARAHSNLHRLMEIAEADCDRRLAAATPRKGSVRAEFRNQKSEVRKTGTR